MSCRCADFEDLALTRKDITKRIKHSKELKRELKLLSKHPEGEHKLYSCPSCDQLWQGSRAWNWGNEEYLFRVPTITVVDWVNEPYFQPDEILIYSAVLENYLQNIGQRKSENVCRYHGCKDFTIYAGTFCMKHQIESLQSLGSLPNKPQGREFYPYN